ncbi:MAG: hypothetical protein ACREOZ_02200 [Gloeomargaritales cyanobacterium]
MARTSVTPVQMVANTSAEVVAGTTIDSTLVTAGVVIADGNTSKLLIEVANSAGGAKNVTVNAGAYPPALYSGQGNLVRSVGASKTHKFGPLDGMRFSQEDGSITIDFETGTTGTISAFLLP